MIFQNYKFVGRLLVLLLFLYAITRFFFLIFNLSYFSDTRTIITSFFYGMRFDLVVISWLNTLPFLLFLLPFQFTLNSYYKRFVQLLFVIVNSIALLFNCVDIAYFEFIQKRSTFDLFQTLGGEHDGIQVLPQYIADYWYVLLLWIGIVYILSRYSFDKKRTAIPSDFITQVKHLTVVVCIVFPLLLLGARGGWQYRPLDMISASNYAQGKNVALVLNTPFCIMKSSNRVQLQKLKYFPDELIKKLYVPIHQKSDSLQFDARNVVIIIMESFGSEYTALAHDGHSLTPVLDSLAQLSTTYTHAYANGKTSIKGIPAIVAGIPALFDGSFVYSAYNTNDFESFASILSKEGYHSSFYHGGNNGTMGFDVFAKAAGFEHYFGRKEYPDQKYYDGHWGIYDEPFFRYFKKGLDNEMQPFISCFFSLSSHHPYTIPKEYQQRFKGNSLAISASVQYADYALGKFFESAQNTTWYKNTLFIITADHTSMSKNEYYQTDAGIYSIPLLVFDPRISEGKRIEKTIQQIDILPTILSQLHYDMPYFAFGANNNSSEFGYAISFNGQYYQLITDQYCLQFDGERSIGYYNLKQDPFMKENLIHHKDSNYQQTERYLKAIIQTYNNSMIENKMTVN